SIRVTPSGSFSGPLVLFSSSYLEFGLLRYIPENHRFWGPDWSFGQAIAGRNPSDSVPSRKPFQPPEPRNKSSKSSGLSQLILGANTDGAVSWAYPAPVPSN